MSCIKLYYRISDKGHPAPKLFGADKETCLMNFCKAFAEVVFGKNAPESDFVSPMTIICDNCEPKTVNMVGETGLPYVETHKGNAGSLRFSIEHAIDHSNDDDIVYFCEDDYLHLGVAPDLLVEGLTRAEYATLYDHPDKYTSLYDWGEVSKVIRTHSTHWRYTISTCMTFGARVRSLREDYVTWEKYTASDVPKDHLIFTELNEKGRDLLVALPGAACHVDLTFSARAGYMTIEPWAIQMMVEHFEHRLKAEVLANPLRAGEYTDLYKELVGNKTGKEKLMSLEILSRQFLK